MPWEPGKTYHCKLTINEGDTSWRVEEDRADHFWYTLILVPAPPVVTVGYGWPPQIRNGAKNARITNVVWRTA